MMKTSKTFLAVDLGASGGKCFAGLFNKNGFTLSEIHRFDHEPVPFYLPDRNGNVTEHMYWDDTLIHANILAGLRKFRIEHGPELDGIGIDTWGADGHFLTPDGDMPGKIYAYRDHRLDSMIEKVKARIAEELIYSITGIHFQPFNISNQILWFLENRRDMLPPNSRFVPMPALFYYYLGGEIKIDSTWASITQLMDAKSLSWSDEVLNALNIPRGMLPEIVKPGSVIGRVREQIARSAGLNQAALIAVGSHDTASAFAAAPAQDPETALIISSGTWSLVGKLVPKPITTPEAMKLNFSNEGGIGNIRLLKNCMGGWLVHELRRVWKNTDGRKMEWGEIYRLAANAPAFAGIIDPDDPVFYNPPDMEKAIADYCLKTGQPVPAERGAFLRMVYESLALKYREINNDICRVSGRKTSMVHIIGGGARNEMLNQFTANALGVPVAAGPIEATAVGNIIVQATGMDLFGSVREAIPTIKQACPIKIYKPQNTELWDKACNNKIGDHQ